MTSQIKTKLIVSRFYFVAALSLIAIVLGSTQISSQNIDTVAFERITVIPMDRERTLTAQTVVVQNGRITDLGPADSVEIPFGATRINGDGRFLLPTLAEMHAHISSSFTAPYAAGRFQTPLQAIERVLLMYVLNGIGTIRNMIGEPIHIELREKASRGEIISPTIYTAGPPFSGATVQTVEAAIEMVASQKASNYDFIKTFPGMPSLEIFNTVARTARELGIPIAGHVPSTVGLDNALEVKIQTIDHLDGYLQAAVEPGAPSPAFWGENLAPYVNELRFPQLVAKTKAAGTWMVPTQSLLESDFAPDPPAVLLQRPEMVYVAPRLREQWTRTKTSTDNLYSPEHRAKFITLRQQLIKLLHEAGVGFILGSDAPQNWSVPGFSIHRELLALVESGLTPYQALATGTYNVANFTGTLEQTGTIEVGKRADILILDANPLINISNSSSIVGVMLNGQWLPQTKLEEMINE